MIALASSAYSYFWVGQPTKVIGYEIQTNFTNVGETVATRTRMGVNTYKRPASEHSSLNNLVPPTLGEGTSNIDPSSQMSATVFIPLSDILEVASRKSRIFVITRFEYGDNLETGRTYHYQECDEVVVRADLDSLTHPTKDSNLRDFFDMNACGQFDNAD